MADPLLETVLSDITLSDAKTNHDLRELLSRLADVATLTGPPLIAPAMLLGDPRISANTQAMRPPDGMGVVHEFQLFRRDIRAPSPATSDIRIRQQIKPVAVVFDIEVGTEDLVTAEMQTRLRFVTRSQMLALTGVPFADKFETADTIWRKTALIERADVERYLALAHDTNPIHVDDAQAQAVGLPAAVLPGMLLCGLTEYMVAHAYPAAVVSELKTRFMAAVPVGQSVSYALVPRKTDAENPLRAARIFVVTQDRMIAAIMDVLCAPKPS